MDEKYYKEELQVLEWLYDDVEKEGRVKIRFKDRIEYRLNGQYHNEFDAAIIYLDDDKNPTMEEYYLYGKKYDLKTEWQQKTTIMLRKHKLKKAL